MKAVKDVIKIDTKWLLHFLKEKHWFNAYITKLVQQNMDNSACSYNVWLNYILNKKEHYINNFEIYINKKQWNLLLIENVSLFNSMSLFALWSSEPYIFSNNMSIECRNWINIKNDFLDLKQQLFLIKADMIL